MVLALSITIPPVAQQPFVPGVFTFRPVPAWTTEDGLLMLYDIMQPFPAAFVHPDLAPRLTLKKT